MLGLKTEKEKEEARIKSAFDARIKEVERMCAIYRAGLATRQEVFETLELNTMVLKNNK